MSGQAERVRESYAHDPEREWQRLEGGVHARLEYLITRHALARHLPPVTAGCRILDAGGGPGRYTAMLARRGYRLTLLDLSPALLTLARSHIAAMDVAARRRIDGVVEGSITDLAAFADARFDAVLRLGGVLSHLPDSPERRRALRELRRVLRPDGVVFISAFNRLAAFRSAVQWPASWSQFFPRLLADGRVPMGPDALTTYAFYPEEFVEELREAGFAVRTLYGYQGLGAHLQEEHMRALMADDERWPQWRQALLESCDHPAVVGVSSHILAVAYPVGA